MTTSYAFLSALLEGVTKEDTREFMPKFYFRSKLSKHLGGSFIGLILKKASAKSIRDFRPISLIRGIYRILAKVMVTESRSAFQDHLSCKALSCIVHKF